MNVLKALIRRKRLNEATDPETGDGLKRALGPFNLIFLGIGTIIGTGIFVLTGQAAAQHAGTAIIVSFIITGVLCAFVALCYAELASAIPAPGSAYTYAYVTGGEFLAWIMGLLLLLEYGIAASTVAVGWSGYVVSLLADAGIDFPGALATGLGTPVLDPATGLATGETGLLNLPAVFVLVLVTALLTSGVSESASVNNVIVVIKVCVVIAFIAVGAFFVKAELWTPLVPDQQPPPPPGSDTGIWSQIGAALWGIVTGQNDVRYGVSGVIAGAATIFFAYLGFEAVSTAGGEARNPSRDMPIGIIGSLLICTLLYILTAAVLVGIVPYTQLNNPAPLAFAVNQMGLPWFSVLIKLGALAGLSSTMLVLLYGQTRIFYSMARDGLLPRVFARVHSRWKTPWINTLLVGVVAAGFAGIFGIGDLANYTNVGTLTAFAIVCIAVVVLRIARPGLSRPFRTPLFPLTPILGAAMCLMLLLSLMADDATRQFFMWYLAIGVLGYFAYGIRKSRLATPASRHEG